MRQTAAAVSFLRRRRIAANHRFRTVVISPEGYYIALTMFSVIFLASPSSIMVLSR